MSNLKSINIGNSDNYLKVKNPTTSSVTNHLASSQIVSIINNPIVDIVDIVDLNPPSASVRPTTNLVSSLSVTHQTSSHTSNSDMRVNLAGIANYSDSNMIYVKPEKDGCNQMAGACENDDYLIVSYKDSDDTKQKIIFYDKKTNEPVGEFTTDKFGHSNALTICGDTVYVVSTDKKICSFSASEALDKCKYDESNINMLGGITYFARQVDDTPEITESDFKIGSTEEDVKNLTSMAYDPKSGVTVTGCADKLFIVKDGKLITVNKFDYTDQFAQTNQDICVAKDSIYVIRTKISDDDEFGAKQFAESMIGKRKSGDEYVNDNLAPPPSGDERNQTVKGKYLNEYNLVDIYDLDGNYKCTKKLPIPEGSNDSQENIYRELESISYDESTDSFTLYFNNPFHNATDDHVIVRGVDLPSAAPTPKIVPTGPLMSA